MSDLARIRQSIYGHFVDRGRAPTPVELAEQFDTTPDQMWDDLRRLQDEHDAIVLLPDSPYLWMAEPFSAVPTDYPVMAGDRTWWGNCIWDALAIIPLVGGSGWIRTRCPQSGVELRIEVEGETLIRADGVAHFAVGAGDWWKSIGFT